MEVKIYSKDNCIFCTKAKAVLSSHNPQVLMLNEDYSRDQFFEIFPTAKTFPSADKSTETPEKSPALSPSISFPS